MAVEHLTAAQVLLADGPGASGAQGSGGRDEAIAAWDAAFGKHDDPEVRARVAAAGAALARRERERADEAARAALEAEAARARAMDKRRRRGRR